MFGCVTTSRFFFECSELVDEEESQRRLKYFVLHESKQLLTIHFQLKKYFEFKKDKPSTNL
jgi:hypothetical protein